MRRVKFLIISLITGKCVLKTNTNVQHHKSIKWCLVEKFTNVSATNIYINAILRCISK